MNDFNNIQDTLCPQLEFVQQTAAQIYLRWHLNLPLYCETLRYTLQS